MSPSSTARAELFAALVDLDDLGVVRLLDEHREREGLSSLVGDLVLPVMKEIGAGWERGEVSVAQEHLSTQVVRAYLDGLRRPPVVGGRQAFLACPPLELHDLPLLALALLLWDQGWQVRFFGANTPLHDLLRMVRVARPELVVVSGDDPDRMSASAVALDLLAGRDRPGARRAGCPDGRTHAVRAGAAAGRRAGCRAAVRRARCRAHRLTPGAD